MKRHNHHNFARRITALFNARASLALLLTCVLAIVVSGCSTAHRIDKEVLVDESLPKPKQILIYDFASSAEEVPKESFILRDYPVDTTVTQTAEESAAGDELGTKIAEGVAERLQASGLPATRVPLTTQPLTEKNDIIIRGYLVSVRQGNAAKRLIIGFGSGNSELKAAAEVFQVTPDGLRKLGSGTGRFGGARGPGAGVGAAGFAATGNPYGFIIASSLRLQGELSGRNTINARAERASQEIASVLEGRAREQGWIK